MDLSTKIRKDKNISLSQIVERFFVQMWIFLFRLATQFFCVGVKRHLIKMCYERFSWFWHPRHHLDWF